jgi:hypothetical protein
MSNKKSTLSTATRPEPEITPNALRRLPRPRAGFERFVEPLLSLHEKQRALLGGNVDTTDLRARFKSYLALATNEKRLAEELTQVQHARLADAAAVWSGLLDIYARAQAAARTNPAIGRAIADFAVILRRRPPRTAKAKEGNGPAADGGRAA